jgi:hypothetical protein
MPCQLRCRKSRNPQPLTYGISITATKLSAIFDQLDRFLGEILRQMAIAATPHDAQPAAHGHHDEIARSGDLHDRVEPRPR